MTLCKKGGIVRDPRVVLHHPRVVLHRRKAGIYRVFHVGNLHGVDNRYRVAVEPYRDYLQRR